MRARPTVPFHLLGLLAILILAAGCLPSSFDLAAMEASLSDPDFNLVFEEFILEEGETTVVGRNISYKVDSYLGVWVKSDIARIAVLTTPSVNAMSMEANPVARMTPRELLDHVLQMAPEDVSPYSGLGPDAVLNVESEEYARVATGIGNFDGSRFMLTAGNHRLTALVAQGMHADDIVVVGVLFDAEADDASMEEVREALATLQHPVSPSETPTPDTADIEAE